MSPENFRPLITRRLKHMRINVFNNLVLCAAFLCILPNLQGCLPVVVAAAAGSGYLVADEEAQEGVGSWFEQLTNDIKNFKIGDEKSAEESMGYKKGSGLAVEINSFSVTPFKVKRGEVVVVKMQYAIAGAEKDGVDLTEQKDLWFGSEVITRLDSKNISRKNGTWESTSSFKVPMVAEAGKHKIKQSIQCGGLKVQSFGYFTVLK